MSNATHPGNSLPRAQQTRAADVRAFAQFLTLDAVGDDTDLSLSVLASPAFVLGKVDHLHATVVDGFGVEWAFDSERPYLLGGL